MVATDRESRRIAGLFNDFLLSNHGFHLTSEAKAGRRGNYIVFTQTGSQNLPLEGYQLVIKPGKITIVGQPAGLFYGMQTLLQLLPLDVRSSIELPAVAITDYPRFPYRGVLLDVGRHFFSVPSIKKFLDLLAQYKINRFHWHLTEDQGWRIEIRKYPQLTQSPDEILHNQTSDPYARGYYTQEQIKDIVAYARSRFITIVPEIEMPGHSQAALAVYPRLGCAAPPSADSTSVTFQKDVFCPKKETFRFLEDVLGEVIALFPGSYIHIGGDEVSKDSWKQSPEAQAIMKQERLKDENELETFFVKRMESFLGRKGKNHRMGRNS